MEYRSKVEKLIARVVLGEPLKMQHNVTLSLEKKTREVAKISMYHLSWNFPQFFLQHLGVSRLQLILFICLFVTSLLKLTMIELVN